jgi:hypothetical protein
MFSISASRSMSSSWVSRTIAGMTSSPARCDARQRRSPMMSSNCPLPRLRTTTGCSKPTSVMEVASSSRASSSKVWRGCRGFGEMAPIGTSSKYAPATWRRSGWFPESEGPGSDSSAGMALKASVARRLAGEDSPWAVAGPWASGMSAPSPLPRPRRCGATASPCIRVLMRVVSADPEGQSNGLAPTERVSRETKAEGSAAMEGVSASDWKYGGCKRRGPCG